MNSDIGGSDMWMRDYLTNLYDVFHAPSCKRWSNLWTPKNDWIVMGQSHWYPKKNCKALGILNGEPSAKRAKF
jgi:hypothetical protein